MLRRVLAWVALIFFIFILVNLLFIHFYPTESATVFLIYVLIFIFGSKKNLFQTNPMQISENENGEQPEDSSLSEDLDTPEDSDLPETPCTPESTGIPENSGSYGNDAGK